MYKYNRKNLIFITKWKILLFPTEEQTIAKHFGANNNNQYSKYSTR